MSDGSTINLFVRGFRGNTMTVDIHKDAKIADLFRKLKDKTGLEPGTFQLIYTSKTIDFDPHKDKYLSDFHLENGSNLYMVMRLYGGSKELDDGVELSDLPDMITWDDDKDNKRAKMPCGHAIGPESLTSYCRSLLDAGRHRLLCPYVDPQDSSITCNAEWEYITVRRLAVLTEAEKQEFEKKISENYLRRAMNIQECPGCQSYCQRRSNSSKCVVCPNCSAGQRQQYQFCWYCLNRWRGGNAAACGNAACSGKDPRLTILEKAAPKEIVGVPGVPSRRACTGCGMLIEHVRACKHMTCVCGQEFCFICLKSKVDGSWQCGAYNAKCEVAPRQKELPS